jgi:hypothetical protein
VFESKTQSPTPSRMDIFILPNVHLTARPGAIGFPPRRASDTP